MGAFKKNAKQVIDHYIIAFKSRSCSVLGRRDVLSGRGKFGAFGDGKELPQIIISTFFKNGDFRSGYYRDQTLLMGMGCLTEYQLFSQLFANTSIDDEPHSSGRQMVCHFSTHSLDENKNWKALTQQKNSVCDASPTGIQMPRTVGLAQASTYYKKFPHADPKRKFSNNGKEVAWAIIGNGSTSEGEFFETINALGVMQVPAIVTVLDDDYAISVENKDQTTKGCISTVLKGFQRENDIKGIEILKVTGWDYEELYRTYEKADRLAREESIPVLVHVTELTQPLGHSTSGSHERYKTKERLAWESDFDCVKKMRAWLLKEQMINEVELNKLEQEAQQNVIKAKETAWQTVINNHNKLKNEALDFLKSLSINDKTLAEANQKLLSTSVTTQKETLTILRKTLRSLPYKSKTFIQLHNWLNRVFDQNKAIYSSNLLNDTPDIPITLPKYSKESKLVDGRVVLRDNFDAILKKDPRVLIFGEDVGKIGDVNQGLEGLQEKYGIDRVFDTGIRESTIIGQGIGLAHRGLKPIAEIQYLDYLLYAINIISDDLACLHYRSNGRQKAPLIIRTRGHRLEGIWHSGSPISGILNHTRGLYLLTPRNMTQASGFYNTLLEEDANPALIIEPLNQYRTKEKLPENIGEFKTSIGTVEILQEGIDITLVSYGSTIHLVQEAAENLLSIGISCEVIDAQTIYPFDKSHDVLKSIQKTNKLLVIDEDVPGGASAYLSNQILEQQGAYHYLDSMPETLTAKDHRPPYGTDGDYFSKPSMDDICEKVIKMMNGNV